MSCISAKTAEKNMVLMIFITVIAMSFKIFVSVYRHAVYTHFACLW